MGKELDLTQDLKLYYELPPLTKTSHASFTTSLQSGHVNTSIVFRIVSTHSAHTHKSVHHQLNRSPPTQQQPARICPKDTLAGKQHATDGPV
jgi:hypothetical protein